MKIGIISDTHIKKDFTKLKKLLETNFKKVDLIIHAGDYTTKNVIDILRKYNNFIGVWGNVDDLKVRKILKEREIIELCGYKVGIYHGHGERGKTLDRAYNEFNGDNVDIIIFGHSHQPIVATKNNVLMLNPGSITSKRREKRYSYIILELTEDEINVTLSFFK